MAQDDRASQAGVAVRGPVILVESPHAGQANGDITPAQALADAGVEVGERILVGSLDGRQRHGPAWQERGIQAVVAAGGDGTIGTVATQIAGTRLPLGILPLGTSNDTARALGIPLDLAAAGAAIACSIPTAIDVGEVVPLPDVAAGPVGQPAQSGAIFVHALTLGLNVAFADLATDVAQRRRWGSLTYAASALGALAQFQAVPITLHCTTTDAGGVPTTTTLTCDALQLAIVNLPLFGGALQLRLPGAEIGNGRLDVVVIEALARPHLQSLVEGLLAAVGRLAERVRQPAMSDAAADSDEALGFALPGVRRCSAQSIAIKTPEPVDVTLDGEVRGQTPLLVRLAASPLPILLPPAARAALEIASL
jgi:diacylglycerol kinase (ATP)